MASLAPRQPTILNVPCWVLALVLPRCVSRLHLRRLRFLLPPARLSPPRSLLHLLLPNTANPRCLATGTAVGIILTTGTRRTSKRRAAAVRRVFFSYKEVPSTVAAVILTSTTKVVGAKQTMTTTTTKKAAAEWEIMEIAGQVILNLVIQRERRQDGMHKHQPWQRQVLPLLWSRRQHRCPPLAVVKSAHSVARSRPQRLPLPRRPPPRSSPSLTTTTITIVRRRRLSSFNKVVLEVMLRHVTRLDGCGTLQNPLFATRRTPPQHFCQRSAFELPRFRSRAPLLHRASTTNWKKTNEM